MSYGEMQLKPDMDSVPVVEGYLEDMMSQEQVPMKTLFQTNVAIDEIYSNIVRYSGAETVKVNCRVEDGIITITFVDNGMPYDPLKNKDPDITASAQDRQIGGLGIFMAKKILDELSYAYVDGLNTITLKKSFDK